MAYLADPGGNFDSDVHRRVQAAVPFPDNAPLDVSALLERVDLDEHLDVSEQGELEEVLADLEAHGYITHTAKGWRQTKDGFAVLTGPIASEVS